MEDIAHDDPMDEDRTPSFEPSSYNYDGYSDFLKRFDTYKTNENKMEHDPVQFKNLPTIDPIRKNTISKLKSMRNEVFKNLYEKYLSNDTERQNILDNKDFFKPSNTKYEDVDDFMNLSKNISQLEKGVYTEENKEMMFLLGEESDNSAEKILRKILDFLKEKKYPLLFTILAATLIGLFVDMEKSLDKASKKLKELIAKQLLKKVKNELSLGLLRAQHAIIEATKKYLIIFVLIIVVIVYYKWK